MGSAAWPSSPQEHVHEKPCQEDRDHAEHERGEREAGARGVPTAARAGSNRVREARQAGDPGGGCLLLSLSAATGAVATELPALPALPELPALPPDAFEGEEVAEPELPPPPPLPEAPWCCKLGGTSGMYCSTAA